MYILIIAGKQISGTCNAGLHLVGNKKYIVSITDVGTFFQITFIGHISSCFTLHWFHQKTSHIRITGKHFGKCIGVVVGYHHKTGRIRSVVRICIRVDRKRNNGGCSSMKIIFTNHYHSLIFQKSFFFVSPFSTKFYSCLHCLGTGIHRQYFFVTEIFSDKLLVRTKFIVVKGPGSKRKLL